MLSHKVACHMALQGDAEDLRVVRDDVLVFGKFATLRSDHQEPLWPRLVDRHRLWHRSQLVSTQSGQEAAKLTGRAV